MYGKASCEAEGWDWHERKKYKRHLIIREGRDKHPKCCH